MTEDEAARASAERQLREEVATLAQKFLQRTRNQADSLPALVDRLGTGEADALEQLQELTHKIHGSGAIFGFSRISEVAGEIERLCDNITLEEFGSPAPDVMRRNSSRVVMTRPSED